MPAAASRMPAVANRAITPGATGRVCIPATASRASTPVATGQICVSAVTGWTSTPVVTGQVGRPAAAGRASTPVATGQVGAAGWASTPVATGQVGMSAAAGQASTPVATGVGLQGCGGCGGWSGQHSCCDRSVLQGNVCRVNCGLTVWDRADTQARKHGRDLGRASSQAWPYTVTIPPPSMHPRLVPTPNIVGNYIPRGEPSLL